MQTTGESDDQQAKYDSYQTLLGMLMTVSTLMLGFILTGTVLSVNFTGEDSFTSRRLIKFVDTAGK